jgi:L-threonylcarbamoyladenylate synthase
METKIVKMTQDNIDKKAIEEAGDILRNGGLVAFPTETVYGLGANALDEKAAMSIYKAKGRPSDNPLIVHIARREDLDSLVESVSDGAERLMEKFWPGPLTIVFKKSKLVLDSITGGLDTVAIRMPNHKITLELIKEAGVPVAAPSANTSGKPSPTIASHVVEDMDGRVDMIIDGGDAGYGVESTVVDVSGDELMILRPGGITAEDLRGVFEKVSLDPALEYGVSDAVPRSPGQKYKHYSPEAEVIIYTSSDLDKLSTGISKVYDDYVKEGKKPGILSTAETSESYGERLQLILGDRSNPISLSSRLFKRLREFDQLGVDVILAEGLNQLGINLATMNRLKKAAAGQVIVID